MDTLFSLDRSVFLFINHLPHTAVSNDMALLLSGIGGGGLVWILLGLFLFFREEKKDHYFIIPFLATGISTFILVEGIMKPLIGRFRPAVDMGALIIGSVDHSKSFPSGHAAIAFALAGLIVAKEKAWKIWVYPLAVAICLSRIYLGKHYPLDVIGGAVVGILLSRIITAIFLPVVDTVVKGKSKV